MNQRFEVRWAHDVHAADEFFRSERQSSQGRVTAVGTAHDRDFPGVGIAFLDGPIHGVDEIVVHLESPLFVACIEELLPVTRGGAIIHLQAGVSPVREPLRVGIVPPHVARPRPAMNEQHRRQVLRRDARRQGQIAVQVESVARLDRDRFHRRELKAVQFWLMNE